MIELNIKVLLIFAIIIKIIIKNKIITPLHIEIIKGVKRILVLKVSLTHILLRFNLSIYFE